MSAIVGIATSAPSAVRGADGSVLIAAGNIGDCSSEGDEATASLVERMDGTVATLGDTTYPAGTSESFAECFDPTWGRFKERIRPVPGNHDYGSGSAAPYFDYFGSAAGDPPGGYYSYDLGTWHVVALNSVCDHVDCSDSSAQLDWLRRDLRATNAECVLAYWHHPRFSSGSIGSDGRMDAAWRALLEAGADAVVSGHAHHYERFAPQDDRGTRHEDGIRQFVVGTGGTDLHAVGSTLLNSEAIVSERHGVLRLDLQDGGYAWQFIAADAGEPLDQGTAGCRARSIQIGSLVRSVAPAVVLLPILLMALIMLLLRLPHFRIH